MTGLYHKRLAILWLVSCAVVASVTLVRRQQPLLTVETNARNGQLIYDAGFGPTQADAAGSEDFGDLRRLTFRLPNTTILQLRFETAPPPKTLFVRNAAVRTLSHLDRAFSANEIVIDSAGSARFALDRPIYLRRVITAQNVRLTLLCFAGLLAMWALAVLARKPITQFGELAARRLGKVDEAFGRVAARCSSDNFLRLDSLAIWFYVSSGLLFALSVLLDLNGSSTSIHQSGLHHGAATKHLLGVARQIRSDEWGYFTPDILYQALRPDRFAVKHSELGGYSVALTGNLPVLHFTTLFRPEFWGFFVVPLSYAFSLYWQAKALVFLCGVFTLLLLLTRSSAWAATGALWYFFSPCIQWCYSWPSALPEMIGAISLATVCACYLTVGSSRIGLALCSAGVAVCSIDFAMCAYLPHMIPLFWLAAAILISWCIGSREAILRPEQRAERVIAVLFAFAVIGGVGVAVYAELRTAIGFVADTFYPGRRTIAAGTLPWWQFTSHLFQWVETELYVPPASVNICEGSGFLWLAPVTLIFTGKQDLSRLQKALLVGLWCFLLLTLAWLVLPLPDLFGRLTGYSRVLATRALPALGLANVAIVCISMARVRLTKPWRARPLLAVTAAVFAGTLLLAYWTGIQLDRFFSPLEILVSSILFTAFVVLVVSARKKLLAVALVASSVFAFGYVNPVVRGIDVFTKSELHGFLDEHPPLRLGKWIIYSKLPYDSGFFAAAGYDVYTGVHHIPDVDHFPSYLSRHLKQFEFNRLGYLNAVPEPPGTPIRWEVPLPNQSRLHVFPSDPLLREIGIQYCAFADKPSAAAVTGLSPLSPGPVDGYWLFREPWTTP